MVQTTEKLLARRPKCQNFCNQRAHNKTTQQRIATAGHSPVADVGELLLEPRDLDLELQVVLGLHLGDLLAGQLQLLVVGDHGAVLLLQALLQLVETGHVEGDQAAESGR